MPSREARSAENERSPELASVISNRAKEIEQRWLDRVMSDIAGTDVELTHLRDGIPDYLAALASFLAGQTDQNGTEGWARVAREHGITRVRIGFDIDQLVHEFVTLRVVIEEVAREDRVLTSEMSTPLADLIEAAIAESVRAYVEARDYEVRRLQAENIGFMIHELRNPLSAAVWAASMARNQTGSLQQSALDRLDRCLQRLTQLVDGVLLTEKLEAGRAEPNWAEVQLGELLDESTATARKAAAEKGLAFEVHADRERKVRVDPELTRSALQNLVDNAVKYTDSGRVVLTIEDRDSVWSAHVRDTCPGLSQEELRTIFEPFRRGSTTKQGTGLGLAIARRAIEAQGGSIHADSTEATGCHFWFSMPKR